ncbi:hypothetical protein M409DRAFT_61947 [Zasmidium cellare ATCC 36951]|uniref:Major facilitator superfamily (MFS) profile domain-containing protein n=1 Tax=Zasmidium cellare ATCC 36951 TaxID=1080233 RepID=A0A6A6D632_ZASCE|nr:uncharacterized protein M409DRAFT_61947 [Zasmidium cellare ATCC 36951]KAF2173609.1 hypothetical protein M409DRAFT_61947 [Zasmidium cellare ATCC 36951]
MEQKVDKSATAVRDVEEPPSNTIDDALVYIQAHREDEQTQEGASDIRRLKRKVDIYVISFLMLCYMLNFLDKVLLNYAQVMSLPADLHLQGNDFSNAASAFFIADLVAVVPNIYLLQRLPTARYLGTSLALWGICTACHAALQNYGGLLTVRILSGAFESVVPSALMLISSQWYTRREQAARFAWWYSGMGIGQILGGLISFAFQHVPPSAALSGWRTMFLVLGLCTLLIGLLVIAFVPNTPMDAHFLTSGEKLALLRHVQKNQTGISEKRNFHPAQILEALRDFQVWAVFAIVVLQSVGGGVITTYSALLIRNFGFSSREAALLNMPAGVINILSSLICGLASRYLSHRWLFTTLLTLPSILGASLLAFLPSTSSRAALLAGIYLVNFITGVQPVDFQWLMCNTAGHTKRAFASAALNAAFAVGNIVGPQTFRESERPVFRTAKVALVCCWCVSVGVAWVLVGYYVVVNRRRDGKGGSDGDGEVEVEERKAFAGLTDKQNLSFRYQY